MRFYHIYLFILTVQMYNVQAWRVFHNGRAVGGNLGNPSFSSTNVKTNFEHWFTQRLDHFNPVDSETWQQRYYMNDQFFNKTMSDHIVFLMIGGEGEATDKWMTQGTWIDYAQDFQALCFQLEHRYYGRSHPTRDLSTKNLIYLSSEQALADISVFIESMNILHGLKNVRWILFGGSYPGSLAAWMRLKYPSLVHGAMSASGPLLAKLDFQEYFKVVADDVKEYGNCLENIKEGTKQIGTLLKHMVGQRNLNKLFNLCDPIEKHIDSTKDVSNLFETLSGNFANVAQYNKDNRIGKNPMANITLDTLCDIMTNQSIGPQVHRLSTINDLILNATNQTCLDYSYSKMISELRNTSWESEQAEGGRQWTYQTCTEFGFFQTSSEKSQIFGDKFPVEFFIDQCVDIFGLAFNKTFVTNAIQRTNTFYGALNIQVSNVVFVHGSIDPWHALGITRSLNKKAPAIYIQGTAHCANMYPSSKNDLPQLTEARLKIKQILASFINS